LERIGVVAVVTSPPKNDTRDSLVPRPRPTQTIFITPTPTPSPTE